MTGKPILPYAWMLVGAWAFASMGTLAHALGPYCDWQVIALARTFLALVFAATLARVAGAKLVFFRPRTLWMRSIAGSISLVGTFYALTRLPVGDVLTLTNMFPIWVGVLSWPLLGVAPPWQIWPAVVCGVVGVVLIQQPHLAEGNFASLVALGCSFTTAVAMIGLHRLHEIDTRSVVVHFSAVSLLFCVAAMFAFDRGPAPADAAAGWTLAMLLGVGVTATIGQICLTKAFASGPPAQVSVVSLTQVGFGMAYDVLVWNRTFSSLTLVGTALVVAPTAWLLVRREAW
ncbi:MAG: DMT family transporter [Pirellulales bacterium]